MSVSTRVRATYRLARQLGAQQRLFTTSSRQLEVNVASPSTTRPPPQRIDGANTSEVSQAPNRTAIWSPSQRPRTKAMTGPRFEQTDFDLQPKPYSAMELVHKQPVRWTQERVVACDGGGGGGPGGHPRIFINVDKPEICACTYCGLPFANEHHRKHLESLPQTSYPLS